MVNYYKLLQVDPSADPDVIAAAYKRLALTFSPHIERLRINGPRYVASSMQGNQVALGDGLIADAAQHRAIAVAPPWRSNTGKQYTWRAWDCTDTQLFLGYGDELYRFDLGTNEPEE